MYIVVLTESIHYINNYLICSIFLELLVLFMSYDTIFEVKTVENSEDLRNMKRIESYSLIS